MTLLQITPNCCIIYSTYLNFLAGLANVTPPLTSKVELKTVSLVLFVLWKKKTANSAEINCF